MNLNKHKKHTDLTYLRSVSKGNVAFEQKMLSTFIQQTGSEVQKLKQALSASDWPAMHLIAHKMKPSMQFVGLNLLYSDVHELEMLAKQGTDMTRVAELISSISTMVDIAIEEIKEELSSPGDK
ncbi:MAG: domain S-box protein [Bacteroidota bacterium]|jgi:HPt (histidine-containing phosphotransfer) domain-containing protein|nr:domain S-box protein [Bacteroidota bacterium]